MAKKSMIAREKRRINLSEKLVQKRASLKKLIKDSVDFKDKIEALKKLTSMPVNSSRSRHVRRCCQCGRPKAVYRRFALCRICLRNQLMRGNVPGARKASW